MWAGGRLGGDLVLSLLSAFRRSGLIDPLYSSKPFSTDPLLADPALKLLLAGTLFFFGFFVEM